MKKKKWPSNHGDVSIFCHFSVVQSTFFRTPLQKKDTEEYKRREEQASKLAAEIEDTAQYKKHIALENGDGDLDEETRFSAVVRTSETNTQSAPFVQSSGGPGK